MARRTAPSRDRSAATAPPVLVIAHRGASGERPEHTAAAYRLAIEQGADFIEPDLVPTRDGVLIARHENELSGTTDIAGHAAFAERRCRKCIDGVEVEGWFAEDFTLAEIRQLRARERLPRLRPHSAAHDGRESIPTLAEVIMIAREAATRGRRVGIYPEIKFPTWFAHEGRHIDGRPIAMVPGELLVRTLVEQRFTDPERVWLQSFDLHSLLDLARRILPAAGLDLPRVFLFGRLDAGGAAGADRQPRDIRYHGERGADLDALYPALSQQLPGGLDRDTGYAALASPAALAWLARHVQGIGPAKESLLERIPLAHDAVPADAPRSRLSGSVHPLAGAARAAGLAVHPYTLRREPAMRVFDEDGRMLDMRGETRRLLMLGATGLFTDHPGETLADLRALGAR